MLSKLSDKFSSIKWKFVVVYFLLVFIAMVIVGVFIVGRLETQQIKHVTDNMKTHIENIMNTSSYLLEDDWESHQRDIQKTIDDWNFDTREALYVITKKEGTEVPIIIASSLKDKSKTINQNAFSHSYLEPTLIDKSYTEGKRATDFFEDENENRTINHMSYPVLTDVGKVKGVLYMTSDLQDVLVTINEAKIILLNATLIALLITISLGFLIADSITEPISDVTKKAEEMAKGDFDQIVEVKSKDEIGQLANMFNYLTFKLKETIEEIDLERSKLDTIFNSMTEGVVAVDVDGYVIHANPVAINILELDDNLPLLSKEERVLFPEERLKLNRLKHKNEDIENGDELTEIGGEIYKVKYGSFKNDSGQLGGLILVFQNITNEHKLDNMRKEFVANVSHELKTPITTIKSYTETLMDGGLNPEIEMDFLTVIDDECDRMGRLVRDLLQLSNLDFKKTIWDKEKIDVCNFLKNIIKKLEFSFKENNQVYNLDVENNIPKILVDKDAIEQVLLNIVSNAIKYTGNGGDVNIKAFSTDNFVTISVADNGIGVPKEDLNRIFERFYRVEKGRSRKLGGTGLGLAIAKEIIDAHNGVISMKSEYEVGTEVEIKLPI